MRYLIKVIFNVKLSFNAQIQAVQVGSTLCIHHSSEGDPSLLSFPARTTFTLRAALLCFPDLYLRDSYAALLLEGQPQMGRKLQDKWHWLFLFLHARTEQVFPDFSHENPKAVMIITTQLGWKKKPKSAEIWSRDSPAPAIPCCAPSWQSSVPGTEPQPERASLSLWATIFLVSVTPFVFFYSYFHLLLNIPLRWHLLL